MPLPIKPALTAAAETRGEGVWEEARAKLGASFRQRGYLSEDDRLTIPANMCWFVTARKP